MENEAKELQEWIALYKKAYLVAEDEKISKILIHLFSAIEKCFPWITIELGGDVAQQMLLAMMKAMENKDFVQIHDLLEVNLVPLIIQGRIVLERGTANET